MEHETLQEPLLHEPVSYSDEEIDDHDSCEEEYDEDEEETSLWSAWKQHSLAILVAVLATMAAMYTQRSERSFDFSVHDHLDDYNRAANVSFCGPLSRNTPDIQLLHWQLPKEMIPTMQVHLDDHQNHCLNNLQIHSPQDFVRGLAYYYETPSLETMFRQSDIAPAVLSFTGFAAKFINSSPDVLLLFWDSREPQLVAELGPFQSVATATQPGASFFVTPHYDQSHALQRFVATIDNPIHYYETNKELTTHQQQLYDQHQLDRQFAHHYQVVAKRPWLAQFPRAVPVHSFWPAEYVGQTHQVGDWELVVESVVPRVLSIRNFWTPAQCQQLLRRASAFRESTVTAGSKEARNDAIRNSETAWVPHGNNPDARQLLRVESLDGLAEDWQLVQYRTSAQYTPHHDWMVPPPEHPLQPTRFATLLVYLNDDFTGGQTVFPRAPNPSNHEGLSVAPETGKAILFYNMLPDGNMDDLSQHGSEIVTSGTKYVANLWLWEPRIN